MQKLIVNYFDRDGAPFDFKTSCPLAGMTVPNQLAALYHGDQQFVVRKQKFVAHDLGIDLHLDCFLI